MSWTPTTGKKITEPNDPWTPQSGRALSQPDFSDEQLLDRLQDKVYAETPLDEFAQQFAPGLQLQQNNQHVPTMGQVRPGPEAAVDPKDIILPGNYEQPGVGMLRQAYENLNSRRNELGGAVGATSLGIGVPLAVNALAPGLGTAAQLALGAAGTTAGAAAGDVIQGKIDPYYDSSYSTVKNAVVRENVNDLIGLGFGAAGKGAYNALMRRLPKAKQSMMRLIGLRGALARPVQGIARDELMEEVGVDFARRGGLIRPFQATRKLRSELAETVARGGFGTQQIFREANETQAELAARTAREWVDEMSGGVRSTDVGQELFDMLRPQRLGHRMTSGPAGNKFSQISEVTDPLYREVDHLLQSRWRTGRVRVGMRTVDTGILDAAGNPITRQVPQYAQRGQVAGWGADTRPLKKWATEQLERDARWGVEPGQGILSAEGHRMLKAITQWPDTVTFSMMQDMRTEWLRRNMRLGRDMDSATDVVSQLIEMATDAMTGRTGRPMPAQAAALLSEANTLYRTGKEAFEDAVKKGAAEKLAENPENWRSILGLGQPRAWSGEGPVKRIAAVKKLLTTDRLGRPDAVGIRQWRRMQDAATHGVMVEATKGGKISPATLKRYMNGMGKDALLELHGKRGVRQMERALALETLTSRKTEAAGIVIHAAQTGALAAAGAQLLYGGEGVDRNDILTITVGGAALIGPRALARLVNTSRGYAIVKQLAVLRPGSARIAPLVTRAVRLLREEDKERYQDMRRAIRIQESRKQTLAERMMDPLHGAPY